MKLRTILGILGLIVVLVCAIVVTVYRFQNPDMTSTRIFLNMWPWEAASLVGAIFFYIWTHD